jgi:hypothetical protein
MADVPSKETHTVTICLRSKAVIQSLKCWCADFCMHRAFVINCTIKPYPANQTSYSPNTKPSSLYTVVFGMGIKIANIM